MLYKIATAAAIFICASSATLSAQPNWVVIPSNYQYTMTVISVAVIQCAESADENDKIAAFINGEVRGVQSLNTSLGGRRFAYMIIYDNVFSGSQISFKLYDASQDTIFNAVNIIDFSENSSIGSIQSPLEVKTDYQLNGLFLTADSIQNGAVAGTPVAELFALNEMLDTQSVVCDFLNDSSGPDNAYFSIANNRLIMLQDVDASMKNRYQIHLMAASESGCTVDSVFVMNVAGGVMTNASDLISGVAGNVHIYPNPAKDQLYFESNKRVNAVSIYDLAGRLVYRNGSLNSHVVDVSALSAQMYVVVFQMEDIHIHKKVLIRH